MLVGKCGTFTGETRAVHNSKYKQSFNWNNVTVYWKLRWWIITKIISIYSILDERKVYFVALFAPQGRIMNVFVRLSICPNLLMTLWKIQRKSCRKIQMKIFKNEFMKHCKSFCYSPHTFNKVWPKWFFK